MAKPIRATPELRGDIASAFVQNMIATENRRMTKSEKELAEAIRSFNVAVD